MKEINLTNNQFEICKKLHHELKECSNCHEMVNMNIMVVNMPNEHNQNKNDMEYIEFRCPICNSPQTKKIQLMKPIDQDALDYNKSSALSELIEHEMKDSNTFVNQLETLSKDYIEHKKSNN